MGIRSRRASKKGNKKAGARDKVLADQRDASQDLAAAQAAEDQATAAGADAHEQSAATAKTRVAARAHAKAKQISTTRRPRKPGQSSTMYVDAPQSSSAPPPAAAPAAAPQQKRKSPRPKAPAAKRPKPGRPSMAPANADAKEARQLVNKRHALKRKLTRMEESEAAAAAENLPTPEDLPWAQTKGGPMAPLARNTVPGRPG